jgi:hypothetical protein
MRSQTKEWTVSNPHEHWPSPEPMTFNEFEFSTSQNELARDLSQHSFPFLEKTLPTNPKKVGAKWKILGCSCQFATRTIFCVFYEVNVVDF